MLKCFFNIANNKNNNRFTNFLVKTQLEYEESNSICYFSRAPLQLRLQ